MKTFWIVVSILCGVAAVLLVVREDYEKMFIVATVGAVAWFLSYRAQLTTETMDKTDEEN